MKLLKANKDDDSLYPIDKFVLVPPGTYPPFTTLLEGLFNKFLGGYNESSSLLALSSFMFSYFVQFLDRYEYKKEDILKTIINVTKTKIARAKPICLVSNNATIE